MCRTDDFPPYGTPLERANARGHRAVNDGPTMGGADRWTCTNCGKAVLRYAGNVYGSAIEQDCDVALCPDCDHAVDGHDLRAFDGECFTCNHADPPGPCSAAVLTT